VRRITYNRLIQIPDSYLYSALGIATGPKFPRWQSPQIQMGGPCGKDRAVDEPNHS